MQANSRKLEKHVLGRQMDLQMYSIYFVAIESVSFITLHCIVNYTMHLNFVDFQEKSKKIIFRMQTKKNVKMMCFDYSLVFFVMMSMVLDRKLKLLYSNETL